MEGYIEKTHEVTVPKNTGVDGFLKAIRSVLGLRNVQNISIDAKGVVRYMRYVRANEGDDNPIEVDYTGLEPWGIIQHRELEDVGYHHDTPAPTAIALMFNRVHQENLVPCAFAMGATSIFWEWHSRTAGVNLSRQGFAYGLPIYTDRQIPDHSVILCASYQRGGLLNCHRFLFMSMSEKSLAPPATSVTVL
jgi:hypothetical protein